MKKFIIILLVLLLVLTCFTGCKSTSPLETTEVTEAPMPENGIVVTLEESVETVEAETAIIEIVNK